MFLSSLNSSMRQPPVDSSSQCYIPTDHSTSQVPYSEITLRALSGYGVSACVQSTAVHRAVHEQFKIHFCFIINLKNGWIGECGEQAVAGHRFKCEGLPTCCRTLDAEHLK